MYIDTSHTTKGSKKYTRYLLRESFRENGKVKHRTVANLSHCSVEEIEAIKLALKHKSNLGSICAINEDIKLEQGLSYGALATVYQTARRLGIVDVLGDSKQGKLALWQICARVLDQGSRLSSVRFAKGHAVGEIIGLKSFDEDDLYENLDWLADKQQEIENHLFSLKKDRGEFFLYDVTSSYFEGSHNELAAYGYNRDGKKGKKQMVAGLLCDLEGDPIAVELFKGNTSDQTTVSSQVDKIKSRFGVSEITMVGDRGMIKQPQCDLLKSANMHYITAITKPQIVKLLQQGVLQMSLFDVNIGEVEAQSDLRYILRRNPIRAEEIAKSRQEKKASLMARLAKTNEYLKDHPKACVNSAQKKVIALAEKLKISGWITLSTKERVLAITIDQQALDEESKLDGCYCIKTDLPSAKAEKNIVHDRYKDLALVEQAFRTSKTSFLQIRPIFLIKENRTKAHALVTMLAYKITRELYKAWKSFDIMTNEALMQLSHICLINVSVKNSIAYHRVPTPPPLLKDLLVAADIKLPTAVTPTTINVHTNTKLTQSRKIQ